MSSTRIRCILFGNLYQKENSCTIFVDFIHLLFEITYIEITAIHCKKTMTPTLYITYIGFNINSQPARGGEDKLPIPRPIKMQNK